MQSFRFHIANVFAESHFGGNQLAVFPDARGFPEAAMQAVARQFNLSETTFVLPAGNPALAARVRIFTPHAELPFAGHPTVGTAAVLARLGRGAGMQVLEENVGPIRVDVQFDGDKTFACFTLDGEIERPSEHVDLAAVRAALSLEPEHVRDAWFASAGVPFCFVHLASPAFVDRARLNQAAWASGLKRAWAPQLFIFAGDPQSERLHARMFAPALGMDEDPATGWAAAALIGSLAERLLDGDGTISVTIDQGIAMGRPSVITASAELRHGRGTKVTVGGNTIIVAEGNMHIPSGA